MSELGKRWAVTIPGVPISLALIWLGGWALGLALALLAAVGAAEFYRLAGRAGLRPFVIPGIATAAALVLIAADRPSLEAAASRSWTLLLFLLLGCSAAAFLLRGVNGRPLEAVAATVAGPLYIGGTLAFALFLRHPSPALLTDGENAGIGLLLFPLLVTWSSDSAAFFVGRAVGRHRLISSISPGKTIEGAVAGLAGGALAAALVSGSALQGWISFPLSVGSAVALGILVSLTGQVGDLSKSVLKREAHVKDSGAIFPGHGGVLDRLDSLFFALPVTYAVLSFLSL